jgi:hypothetical protein
VISVFRKLRTSVALGSVDISGYTVTNASLNYSESFAPAGMDVAGIIIDPGSTATGTAPDTEASLQFSPDGGTTWVAVPGAGENGATASVSPTVGTGSTVMYYVKLPVSESGAGQNPLYRWAFTYNNADNDFAGYNAWLFQRKYAQRHP